MYERRRQLIDEVSKSIPNKELYNRSGYYVVDDVVVKARGVAPEELTPRDILHFTKPECRMVIQRGRHLECHFPLYAHCEIRNILEGIRGFTYTLYSCETALESAKKTVANSLLNKVMPSIVLSYESFYYVLDGKVVKANRQDSTKLTPEDILTLRNPGELTIFQEAKHLKIYASKDAKDSIERRLSKAEKLGFTYELILE